MKAVRVHKYHQQPTIDEVAEPTVTGPFDVVVKIGGAGVCRTDLHIIEEQWADKTGVALPCTIGHENAGWVHDVGSAVSNVAVGDTVIPHPTPLRHTPQRRLGPKTHELHRGQELKVVSGRGAR